MWGLEHLQQSKTFFGIIVLQFGITDINFFFKRSSLYDNGKVAILREWVFENVKSIPSNNLFFEPWGLFQDLCSLFTTGADSKDSKGVWQLLPTCEHHSQPWLAGTYPSAFSTWLDDMLGTPVTFSCHSVLVKVPSRGRAESLLESPGRESGEGWSQGWRTPKSVDPLAALGPICHLYGLPPGQALAPAFPHLWLLGVYCPAPSLVAQRGASGALQSPAPLCQLLGTLITTLWPPPPWSLRICFLCHRCFRPLKPCYHGKE